jgi:hypothetical protein
MKAISLLVLGLLTSCATSQLSYNTQDQVELGRAKKLESLGLREYTVITKDTTYYVQIPIDSVICHDTFEKYFKYNRD